MATAEKTDSIENMIILARRPTHPGEMLREEFMAEYELTVTSLAKHLDVSRQTVNELVHERRAVSPEMALRLAQAFSTSPQYWLNMQRNIDLWDSLDMHAEEIAKVMPVEQPEAVAC